jgi:nitrite reductase/ring-hydroxylating ferredoxin subunit
MLRYFFKKKLQFALLSFVFGACQSEFVCPIPNVERFEFQILMPASEIMTAKMRTGYGYKKSKGVIVFRYNSADHEVFAFDATCPDSETCMEADNGKIAHDGNGYGVCQRCKARYSLSDGRHTSKKIMLRPYGVEKMATDFFRVRN